MIDLNKKAKPNKTIREHTDDLLANLEKLKDFNYIDEKLYELMKITCEYHDYGKINNEFQKRVKSRAKINFDNSKEVAHNVLSLCFLNKENFRVIDEYYKVAYAILNHHHNTKNFEEIRNKKNLIAKFIEDFGGMEIEQRDLKKISLMRANKEAILLKGFLHKCDYSASGNYEIEYRNNFLIDSLNNNFLTNLKKEKSSADWNELQIFCKENSNSNIMIVANTGMGKTEAGLLWIGDNKGFFILPLKTAINAIYERVKNKIIQNERVEERIALLHSDTMSYYLTESIIEEDKLIEYTNKGKQLSMPLTISTLDQLFNFVYKYNGFEIKMATLSYSKIVIDEIQAYSPDLLAYLVYGLEEIVKVGGKFAILTATLPPFIKDYITQNIKGIKFEKFTEGKNRHNLKVLKESLNTDCIAKFFNEKGGKILVICNTVKKAQEIYDDLEKKIEINNIELLHAKYTREDRKIKEDSILKFGDTKLIGDKIWISTSVVEASLDIDFDYLFTELNDLNSFFQRLGRVNRKGEKNFMINEPNAFLFTEINERLFKNSDDTKGFIDKDIYELSKKALIDFDGILSESKKVELIDKFLTTENIKESNFNKRFDLVKKYVKDLYPGEKTIEEVKKMFRNIISYNVIPESIYEKKREEIEKNIKILNEEFIENENLTLEENNNERKKLYLEKKKAREKIYDFTVSVGLYDLNKIDSIKWKNEEIEIIKCNYSIEKGFEKIKNIKQKEEKFDNFS